MTADGDLLARIVGALAPVRGISAIALGGSRARGTDHPTSDYDIGLYYADSIDMPALSAAVASLVDDPAMGVTELGEWGPWINGGGWLRVAGVEVDLLYRDLAKVRTVIDEARAGRFTMDYQVGHPHGFCSAILAGEVALGVSLHDSMGAFAELRDRALPYPPALKTSLLTRFAWEVDFAIENGELAARRDERTHLAGCAYRALCCIAQVLFAINERYLINEKGAIQAAAALPLTIDGLATEANAVWEMVGQGWHDGALSKLCRLSARMSESISTLRVRRGTRQPQLR